MSKDKDDGGFVSARSGNGCEPLLGITRRDWLAGLAMQGQISSMTNADVVKAMGAMTDDPFQWCAESAYRYADTMIAEGKKP